MNIKEETNFENLKFFEPNNIDVLDDELYNYLMPQNNYLFNSANNSLKDKTNQKIAQVLFFADVANNLDEKEQFVSEIPEKFKKLYEQGDLLLKKAKDNSGIIPVLVDKKGKIVKQLRLKEKMIPNDLPGALSNMAMQQQLAKISEQLESINLSLNVLEQGFHDDRIALCLSAKQKYIEAISLNDEGLQKQYLLSAANTANDARCQLLMEIKCHINSAYNCKKVKDIDDRLTKIKESLLYYNFSSQICMVSFYALGEYKSLLVTLKSYECFLEQILLGKSRDQIPVYMWLHTNWKGNDEEWLKIPNLKDNICNLIEEQKGQNLLRMESEQDG